MLYTTFLTKNRIGDSEGSIEAYADITGKYAADNSLSDDDAYALYRPADYNWIDRPTDCNGNELTSKTQGERRARIDKERARNIIMDEFLFCDYAIKVRGLAYFEDAEHCFIRFEVGEHAFVYADGCLYETPRE